MKHEEETIFLSVQVHHEGSTDLITRMGKQISAYHQDSAVNNDSKSVY